MNLRRVSVLSAVTLVSVVGCDGLKSAFSMNPDVAAKAGKQELTVERLGNLLGGSQAPLDEPTARAVADLWVSYQLVARAAAEGDSLADTTVVDAALETVYDRMRVEKWQQSVMPTLQAKVDTNTFEQQYAAGALYHARHILVSVPQDATPAQRASLKTKAEGIRARVTSANFAQVATRESNDPGSAKNGGLLGAFPKGAMVAPFEAAVAATKPGEISPVIETQFGYHIIRRSTYAEAKPEVGAQMQQLGMAAAESTFIAGLEKDAGISYKSNAIATLRSIASSLSENTSNKTVIASMKGGDYRAADAAKMLLGIPQRGQIASQLAQAPDSVVRTQLLEPMVRTAVVVRAARAANLPLDTAMVGQVRRSFGQALQAAWAGLGVAPSALTDSAKTPEDKAKLAATRVEATLDRIIAGQAPVVQVPMPVESALRGKFAAAVSAEGLKKSVEKAKLVRAQADSARAAAVPQSAVPLPGGADKALPSTPVPAPAPAAGAKAPGTKQPE